MFYWNFFSNRDIYKNSFQLLSNTCVSSFFVSIVLLQYLAREITHFESCQKSSRGAKNPAATPSALDLIVIVVMIVARGGTIEIDGRNHVIARRKRKVEIEHRKEERRNDQMRDQKKDRGNVAEVCKSKRPLVLTTAF